MTEFKTLENFPNYEINLEGEVYNKKTDFRVKGSLNKGYRFFRLPDKQGIITTVSLHRLLAQTFLENPNNLNQVDHIDNNKQNNNISNLRFCTRAQNNMNRNSYSCNKEGFPEKRFKYVNWNKTYQIWQGQITLNGKNKFIGRGDNDEELYIMCLDYLYSIFKDNEFYSNQIQEDLIYYNIAD